MFFIQKLVNNNLFKNNHIIILWNVLQVIGCRRHQSTRTYFKGRAHIKIIIEITLGLIIGETRYQSTNKLVGWHITLRYKTKKTNLHAIFYVMDVDTNSNNLFHIFRLGSSHSQNLQHLV